MSPEERATILLKQVFPLGWQGHAEEHAIIAAIRAAVFDERAAIVKYGEFLLKEHCATKGEARGISMFLGSIRARGEKP